MIVADSGVMDGRSFYYLAGGIILHSLSGKCAHYPDKLDLTEKQLGYLCNLLNIKKPSLLTYTDQLAEKCCGQDSR